MVKVLGTPASGQEGVPMDPNSENAFPKRIFLTKLDTYQDYSKTLILTKEKLKNNVRSRK